MNASKEVPHERFIIGVDEQGVRILIDTQIPAKTLAAQLQSERYRKVKERRRAKRNT